MTISGHKHELKAAVYAERARCVAIVQAARFGEIDHDFRSIVHMIESGETVQQLQARDAYPAYRRI
jgi:hypothetical protein